MTTTPLSPPKIGGELEQEFFRGAAPIMEFDGEMPREEAERKAGEMISPRRDAEAQRILS